MNRITLKTEIGKKNKLAKLSHEDLDIATKGNIKRETESLQMYMYKTIS